MFPFNLLIKRCKVCKTAMVTIKEKGEPIRYYCRTCAAYRTSKGAE